MFGSRIERTCTGRIGANARHDRVPAGQNLRPADAGRGRPQFDIVLNDGIRSRKRAHQKSTSTTPKGFTVLFNGKDLSGWHGMPHFDPYKLAAMPSVERHAQIEKWTEEA